jgi:hypothetical protein
MRVRIGAKRWQKMVLAGTCRLKNKSPLASINWTDPFGPELFAGGTGESRQRIRLWQSRVSCSVCLRFLQGCDGNNSLEK